MSDLIATIFTALFFAAIWLFAMAWVTFMPVIGLLWIVGWLP